MNKTIHKRQHGHTSQQADARVSAHAWCTARVGLAAGRLACRCSLRSSWASSALSTVLPRENPADRPAWQALAAAPVVRLMCTVVAVLTPVGVLCAWEGEGTGGPAC
jgi:hypothetical protein